MNATGANAPRTLLSLVRFLSDEGDPRLADVNVAQIVALGNLDPSRRASALSVLSKGFVGHINIVMRRRLMSLIRHVRGLGHNGASLFLLDLFIDLGGEEILIARERALQAAGEGKYLIALDLWKAVLVKYNDELPVSNVAFLLPNLAKHHKIEVGDKLLDFVNALAETAAAIATTPEVLESLITRAEGLVNALQANGFLQEARIVRQVAFDLKMKQAFKV